MKDKLIFRILGALASALIIVSVFIPFVNVTGYSFSLWGSNMETNSLYLPIMIIVFGVIGVIFFSLNIKTEFAYMSTGAITFFLVVQTIDILDQGVFNTLGIGYYCMVLGTFLTGLMAFLMNLRGKEKIKNIANEAVAETQGPSILAQIDGLYSNENNLSAVQPIQPVPTVDMSQPIQPVPTVDMNQPIEPVPTVDMSQPIQPAPLVDMNQPIVPLEPPQALSVPQVNPVIEQFSQPSFTSPVQDFSTSNSQLVQNNEVADQGNNEIKGFITPSVSNESLSNMNSTVQTNQTSSGVDIFGQPMNK